jgi:hypothetical protein
MITSARREILPIVIRACGIGLLLAWLALWVLSFLKDQFLLRGWSWLPFWDRLAIDFTGNFLCSRAWIAGSDPYRVEFTSPIPVTYGYTPQTLWHFAWCALIPSFRVASIIWFGAAATIIAFAAGACLRCREELGLRRIDPAIGLALVLFSSPVLFELERLNCNALVLLHLLIAVWALRARSLPGDLFAGAAIALASWTKIYPAVMIPALLVLARPRAFVLTIGFAALFGALDLRGLGEFWQHREATASIHHPAVHGAYYTFTHPIGAWWLLLWRKAGVFVFDTIPEVVIAGLIILPFVFAASRPILNLNPLARSKFVLPYLLFVVSAGTFILPIANDYNLLFLPLALLCVVGRSASWALPVLFAISLPWLQPFPVPIDAFGMTVLKLCCLGAATAGLRVRAAAVGSGALP